MNEGPLFTDIIETDGSILRIYKGSLFKIDGIPYEILMRLMQQQSTWIYDEKQRIPEVIKPVGKTLADFNFYGSKSEEAAWFLRVNRDFLVEELEKEKHRENVFMNEIMKQI